MGFFKKLFKGIKNVVKGIGRAVKKVVKSKAFKVIATIALAFVAPQLIGHALNAIAPTLTASSSALISGIGNAMQTAGTYLTGSGATTAIKEAAGKGFWANVKAVGTSTFQSVTEQISGAVNSLKGGGKSIVTPKGGTTSLQNLAAQNNISVAELKALNPNISFHQGRGFVSGAGTVQGGTKVAVSKNTLWGGMKERAGKMIKEQAKAAVKDATDLQGIDKEMQVRRQQVSEAYYDTDSLYSSESPYGKQLNDIRTTLGGYDIINPNNPYITTALPRN